MASDDDADSKTEDPTAHRIEKAKGEGSLPFSRELGAVALLLAIASYLLTGAESAGQGIASSLAILLSHPSEFKLEAPGDVVALLWWIMERTAYFAWPLFATILFVGLAASLIQNPPRLVLQRIKPDPSRLSLAKGFKRLFSNQSWLELAKSLVKFGAISIAAWQSSAVDFVHLLQYEMIEPAGLSAALAADAARALFIVGAFLAAVSLADVLWSRFRWRHQLRMTKQEVKDEYKQNEGDPAMRARRRHRARELIRQQLAKNVPRATLVIANPTHYAIALRYVMGETAAPIVVAKGVDGTAMRIRSLAETHQVPVVESPALARSLYGAVSVDAAIPREFFKAVAEIIIFITSRNRMEPA